MAKNEIQKTEPPQSPIIQIGQLVQQSDGKIDTAGMEKLLEMHFRHEADEARKVFASDFAVVQSRISAVVKTERNPQTGSMYAGLDGVIEMAKPVYTEQGFSIIYYEGETSVAENIRVCADVLHRAGHKETYHYDVPLGGVGIKGNVNMTKIHAKATSVTYGRRYLLCMIWNIPTQDDDGNGAGEGPPPVKPPTKTEQEVIDAICKKIPAPAGKRVDAKKVAAIIYGEYQRYPSDMKYVDSQAKWFAGMNKPELFIPENRCQFEIDNNMPGDEDSVPDTEAEARAAEKFGEENDQVVCRFLCNHCSHEYDTYKKIDQCPACLHKDVVDRQQEKF